MARLPPRVVEMVQTEFTTDQQPLALELLQRYGVAPHERDHERVWVALLELSQGNILKLREALELAKVDYRDVLLWAEERGTAGKRWIPRAVLWLRRLRGRP